MASGGGAVSGAVMGGTAGGAVLESGDGVAGGES